MGRGSAGGRKRLWEGASGWVVAAVAGVAAAVAAGTVPDVIKGWWGDQPWFLTGLCLLSAVAFAGINLWQQRTKGVGIVIALPREEWRGPWSGQWIGAAIDHARRHHDSCFAVRRSIPGTVTAGAKGAGAVEARKDALELAYELATARLAEIAEADPSTPVSIYVNAALPDAFELGAMFKPNVQRDMRGIAAYLGVDADGSVVAQRSENVASDFFPAVPMGGRLKQPLNAVEARRAATLAEVIDEPEFEAAAAGEAVAVVVHLADNPQMVAQALRAAGQGCLDARGRLDRCRAALVVDGGRGNIPETSGDFELIVRHVYTAWATWAAARPQYANLRTRLFVAAPASVAFALGWLFGHTVVAVPHPYQTGESCTSS